MDMNSDRVKPFMDNLRFHFFEGDITINKEWIEYHIKSAMCCCHWWRSPRPRPTCRTPARVRARFRGEPPVHPRLREIQEARDLPSTSEVYGMCADEEFDPHASNLVLGPIEKQRWIYSCSKQLMDRVIYAYGSRKELDFTFVPALQLDRRGGSTASIRRRKAPRA